MRQARGGGGSGGLKVGESRQGQAGSVAYNTLVSLKSIPDKIIDKLLQDLMHISPKMGT